MAGNYDAIDLRYTWNGDYDIGIDGDLADTAGDALESVRQEVQTISNSEINDWKYAPAYAATLSDFIGHPNTKPTADAIHDRLRIALVANSIVLESDLSIRVIPVHKHKVLIVVKISAAPTALNRLAETVLSVALVFDFVEDGVFFLDQTPQLMG